MLFPTIEFFVFFALVFTISWTINFSNAIKKIFLVFVSYFFYAQWDWRFIFLLFGTTVANYCFALLIEKSKNYKTKRFFLASGVIVNLSCLVWFKYLTFLSAHLQNFALFLEYKITFDAPDVALPVAISFLTFHAISYLVDTSRGQVAASKSLVDVMLYMAFFPHLVAGPIVRAADFFRQLVSAPNPQNVDIGKSLFLIVGGLFKKVVIAGHLSILIVDPVFQNPEAASRVDLFMAMLGYAVVIYCDFSAYTDIAIGVANLLGYHFPTNFNHPYRALTIQEFWRRWHITLSSWLRDYLYIPLGGSRRGSFVTYRNLIIVMFLGGLWHGAGLQFVLWGLLHGAGLAVERFFGLADVPLGATKFYRAIRWCFTFLFVVLAWVLFRAQDIDSALQYFSSLWSPQGSEIRLNLIISILIFVGVAMHFVPLTLYDRGARKLDAAGTISQGLFLAIGIAFVSVLSPGGVQPFIYFQF
jgi:alginate O-acetyltransferase complex protein AlgI